MFKKKFSLLVQILILTTFSLGQESLAHDFSSSYSKFQVDRHNLSIEFTIKLADLHAGPNPDINGDGLTSPKELDGVIGSIFQAIVQNFQIRAPDLPSQTQLQGYNYLPGHAARLQIAFTFAHPVNEFRVNSTLDLITQANHQHLLQIGEGTNARHEVLSATQREVLIDYGNSLPVWHTIQEFTEFGFRHIFSGYDHLAFLVGLLLTIKTLGSLVKLTTSFTLGHSLTLALATFNLVVLPSRLIESLIALTIAYIAIESFTGYTLAQRWKITFLFGLIHGFGFANVLRGMELNQKTLAVSLFSFNAGVEIGQVLFVCALLPAMFYLDRTTWKSKVVEILSLVIMSLGFYFFFRNALLPYYF